MLARSIGPFLLCIRANVGVTRAVVRPKFYCWEPYRVAVSLKSPVSARFSQKERLLDVANIKSQKKRILTNAKATARNRATKSEVRTRLKKANDTIGTDENPEALRLAVKRLDMAAAKRVIHPNQAARKKSRLMKKINAASKK